MKQIVRWLLLLLALFSVVSRLAPHCDCAHEHAATEHHDEDHSSHEEPCHPHHCTCHQAWFMAPLVQDWTKVAVLQLDSQQRDTCHWRLPDDPVYPLDIPPIIS